MLDQCSYQNVMCVVIKNQDLWKNKKEKGLSSSVGLKTPLGNY